MSGLEKWMFYIMIIVFLLIGCGGILHEIYVRLRWQKTEGKVVGFESKEPSHDDYGGITPIVVYLTNEGHVKSHNNFFVTEALCKYRIGQAVNIYYKENNVKKFRIIGDKAWFFVYIIFAVIGGALLTFNWPW